MSLALATKGVISGIGGAGSGLTVYAEKLLAPVVEDCFVGAILEETVLVEIEDILIDPWWLAAGVMPYAAYSAEGAADYAASLVDLTGNGHDLTEGVAPTWDAVNGWQFNGSTMYLVSDFVPENDQSQSAFVQFANASNGYLFGLHDSGVGSFYIFVAGGSSVFYTNGGFVMNTPDITAGNLGVAGDSCYRNGVLDATSISAWTSQTNLSPFIGCGNEDGSPANYGSANIRRLIFFDTTLDASESAAIAAAMAG